MQSKRLDAPLDFFHKLIHPAQADRVIGFYVDLFISCRIDGISNFSHFFDASKSISSDGCVNEYVLLSLQMLEDGLVPFAFNFYMESEYQRLINKGVTSNVQMELFLVKSFANIVRNNDIDGLYELGNRHVEHETCHKLSLLMTEYHELQTHSSASGYVHIWGNEE